MFWEKVAADEIPYIVVPPNKKSYKFSSGVVVNQNDGSYLYCVVDEVSIYAAWIMVIKIVDIGFYPGFAEGTIAQNNKYIFYPNEGNKIIKIEKKRARKNVFLI